MSTNKNFKRREAARRRNAQGTAGGYATREQHNASVPGYNPIPDHPSTTATATPAVATQADSTPVAAPQVAGRPDTIIAPYPATLPVIPSMARSVPTQVPTVSYHSGNFPHGKTVFQPPAVNAENTNPAAAQETPAKQQAQTLPAEPVFERLPPPRPSSDQQSGETPVAPQTPKSDSGSSVAFDERDW